MKVAFITYAMAPYRSKQFEEIVKTVHIDLSVYYIGRSAKTRNWQVNRSQLFRENKLVGHIALGTHFLLYSGIKQIVLENDLFLLGGYDSTAMFIFLYYIRKYHKKSVFVMDGISPKRLVEVPGVKHLLKRLFIKKMDAFFANGKVSKDYLLKNFGVLPEKIFNQYLTVDIDRIHEITKLNKEELTDKFVLLYSGRLLPRKRVSDLLYAVALSGVQREVSVLIIGSGSELSAIKKLGNDLSLDVSYIDFISNQDELFETYGTVNCLVLPSEDDPWGLVVNEAEAASLPVIVSDACGCVFDLVKDGVNGYTYESNNIENLSEKIVQMYNNSRDSKDMGNESFKIISGWKFSNSAQSFVKLVNSLGVENEQY